MTKAKRISNKLRWILLGLWVLCLIGGLVWVFGFYFELDAGLFGTPAVALFGSSFYQIIDQMGESGYFLIALMYIGIFFLTQWLFLSPRKLWRINSGTAGRPMKKAAIGAAFAIALLTAGLFYSILDLFLVEIPEPPLTISGYLLISISLILWILWSVVFCTYFRQTDHYTWAGRIVRGLIAGSILELFVSIPVFVTRQDDCYCFRGSYAGLVFGGTVLLWAFGPAVFLLFLREKRRMEKVDITNV